jgi:type I restriction enzyme M protein
MPNQITQQSPLFHNHLDLPSLEQWLWDAACQIHGPVDAPKYKDYILPLVFLKRLSDVFDDEVNRLAETYSSKETADALVEADHSLVRFYMPMKARWSTVELLTTGLGQALTDAMRAVTRENPRLSGVIDVTDFNATTAGMRIIDDEHLYALVQVLRRHRLGFEAHAG